MNVAFRDGFDTCWSSRAPEPDLSQAAFPESALGRDHQAGRVGMQGFRDQTLAHLGAVGVRRVDEVDAELEGASQDSLRSPGIARLAPDARSRDSHRAVADAPNGQVASEQDRVVGQAGIV
jgi:hypothetical protein